MNYYTSVFTFVARINNMCMHLLYLPSFSEELETGVRMQKSRGYTNKKKTGQCPRT